MHNLTCKSCGWVHFAVSREHAVKETVKFANYYNSLSKKEQLDWYGGKQISLIRAYARCGLCGKPNTNMRDSTTEEIQRVYGCTLSGIIVPEERVV